MQVDHDNDHHASGRSNSCPQQCEVAARNGHTLHVVDRESAKEPETKLATIMVEVTNKCVAHSKALGDTSSLVQLARSSSVLVDLLQPDYVCVEFSEGLDDLIDPPVRRLDVVRSRPQVAGVWRSEFCASQDQREYPAPTRQRGPPCWKKAWAA